MTYPSSRPAKETPPSIAEGAVGVVVAVGVDWLPVVRFGKLDVYVDVDSLDPA